ncbi:MAG: GreA/GreB family elongation factor [Lentisphaeria bacterium]
MSENIVEEHDFELDSLCCAAAEFDEKALQNLVLLMKDPAWRKALSKRKHFLECQSSLELVAESLGLERYVGAGNEFVSLALELGFDTPLFRECYASLAKQVFASYGNPAGLAEAIGFREPDCEISTIRLRLQMMGELKVGAFCYDAAFGLGKVSHIDGLANEIALQSDRKRSLRLRSFFDSQLMVKNASPLYSLLQRDKLDEKAEQPGYLAELQESLLAQPKQQQEAARKILLARFLSEEDYEALAAGRLSLEKGEPQDAEPEGQSGAPPRDLRRWDQSRNLDELLERLKDGAKAPSDDLNLANLRQIFRFAAVRIEQAETFANASAMLYKENLLGEHFAAFVQELGGAGLWSDEELFVEQTDKLALKLIPAWLAATQLAKGSQYLVDAAVKLPYRLWTHIEKLLAKNPEEKDLLAERVFADFAAGKVSAEHYFWLWKAPKSERRSEYLANSYLLFKTLHQDVKGNYLRSKRNLMKLLIDDEKFQRQIMNMGDPYAIRTLVRCVKHQPLLDKSERQSLLVKIVRHYPQAIGEVEEKSRSRKTIANITSLRSYAEAKAQLEELINVLMPENVAAIEQARSHGDLRENSEFKYAKERQAFLASQRAELEEKLQATKAIDFAEVKVENQVVPGCQVSLKYASGRLETFKLLGLFDSKPEDNIIAYDSPLGKTLVGASLNDELQLPSGDNAVVCDIKPLPQELLQWLNNSAS